MINFKNYSKKIIFVLPILFIIILALCYYDIKIISDKMDRSKFAYESEKICKANKKPQFKINKIIKYNSAEAEDNSVEQNLQDIDIHQYSDVALYIDNLSDEVNVQNTIKELYIDNFNIQVDYDKGTTAMYYKNPFTISKFRMIEENEIKDRIDYKIIKTNEANENNNYENPVFYADCSNPIVLGYINKNIVENYDLNKSNGLVSYDGRIFETLGIDLKKISPTISFSIHIKNNIDEHFVCDVKLKLDMESDEGSIKSGYFIEIMDNINEKIFFKEV